MASNLTGLLLLLAGVSICFASGYQFFPASPKSVSIWLIGMSIGTAMNVYGMSFLGRSQ